MTDLITGHLGFIGGHLDIGNSQGWDLKNGIDIRNVGTVNWEYNNIYHLAALTSVPESFRCSAEYFSTNVGGTENMTKVKHRKFIFASTAAVYGDGECFEHSPQVYNRIASPYGLSKYAAEALVKRLPSYAVCRFFNVFGPGATGGVVKLFIEQALRGDDLTICGDGRQTRDFIFIDDIVDGLRWCSGEQVPNGVYNLGYGKPIEILELAELVIALTGSNSKMVFIDKRDGDLLHSFANVEKAKALGWNPRAGFMKGLARTIAAHRGDTSQA